MAASLKNRLRQREMQGNLRRLHRFSSLTDFSSNDYLGLARSSSLAKAVREAWGEREKHSNGWGSTGSRLLTGNSEVVEALEDKIAAFHGYEAGVLFNCGYMANVGLLSAVGVEGNIIFFDAGVHASVRDGIRLGQASAFAFRHNDLHHLEERLKRGGACGDRFICVESVYSTDGSRAPIPGLCALAERYGAHLIVDEAHAVGIFGPEGRGVVAEYSKMGSVFAQVVTFGKALGTFGAMVLGSHLLKQGLINFATSYVYTTALPEQMLMAIRCSYDRFPRMELERRQLKELIRVFQQRCSGVSATPIQPVRIQGNREGRRISQALAQVGFDVRPLLSPTVRRGSEVLRIALHAFNTKEELERLIEVLREMI